ncbi:MAG: condensation domain-containing protein [Desulfobacter sp.]
MTSCVDDMTFTFLSGISFLEQFYTCAVNYPNRPAVRDDRQQLTFKALDRRSCLVAGRLRTLGLGESTAPEYYDIGYPERAGVSPWVMVLTGRTVDVAVGILSVLRAGGAYICVPGDAPLAYIRQIAETAKVTAVLTSGSGNQGLENIPCIDLTAPLTDQGLHNQAFSDPSGAWDRFIPHPRDMATAIFTSGSTGRPKGVVLEHQAISAMLAWQKSYMDLPPGSHTAAFAPLGFIAAPWELLFPLASGMTLHILSEQVRRDPLALETYFERHGIRYVFLSPDMAEMFSHNCRGQSLKYVRVAGGPLRSCSRTSYEILYSLGMSENGGSVTFLSIQKAYESDIPLGGAFGPSHIYLLDDQNNMAGPGEIGRMAVSSPSLARGYLGMPDQTRDCFIANPFTHVRPSVYTRPLTDPGSSHGMDTSAYNRLYLSGDLARLDENGMLVHCGRSDFVVKIRGMRVDPGHVEAVLASCDGVRECVVAAQKAADQVVLWAWAAGDNLDAQALKSRLAALVPDYMVPDRIKIMQALPRGVHGKIQRSRLPQIPAENMASADVPDPENPVPGHDPRLERLCDIFAKKLLVSRVTPLDNFFALGGDSLKLAGLQLMLRSEFSVDLPYGKIFRRPWPSAVLEMMDLAGNGAGISRIPASPPRDRYPLTMPMRQMYLLWRLGRDPRAYEVDTCMMVEGDVDGCRLEQAFARLVAQEPLLRSRFIEKDGEPFWVIDDNDSVTYDFVFYSAPDPEQARLLWEKLSLARPAIDLSRSPLFYVVCIEINSRCSFLGLTTHHILVDAASSRLLVDAWWDLYTVGKIHDPGGGQTVPMTDYVLWDRARQDSQGLKTSERFWQERLSPLPPPLDLSGAASPRPSALTGGSAVARVVLGKEDRSALAKLADVYQVSVFQTLLAVWAAFISRQAAVTQGFGEIVMGVPFAGRDHPALQFCKGMFVRTLPLRFRPKPDGSQPFSDWLRQVRESFLDAWEHQACSLERIVQLVRPLRIPGRSPLFDVMINRLPQPRPFPVFRSTDQEVSARIVPGFNRPTAIFDIILEIREGREQIFLELTYARDLFQPGLMKTWADAVAAVVRTACADPGRPIGELPWPSDRILAEFKPAESDDDPHIPPFSYDADWAGDDMATQALITAWQEVLGVSMAGPADDFFALGGDSITAMRLEAELFKAGWYLPATTIYEQARLGELIQMMEPANAFDDEDDEFA